MATNKNKKVIKSDADRLASSIKPKQPSSTKRTIKNLTLNFPLNEEQKKIPECFYKFDYTFIIGDAGVGKTLVAVHTALNYLMKGECSEIWISRPMLKNQLAALPGDIRDKMFPYTFPIIQNIEACIGKVECERLIEEGIIRIMPIEVAKGVTFTDAAVIIDEVQDTNYEDFRTILSRLGNNSKMMLCGSKQQISRLIGKESAIYRILPLEKTLKVGFVTLTTNHRSKSLEFLLPFLDKAHEEICEKQNKQKEEFKRRFLND